MSTQALAVARAPAADSELAARALSSALTGLAPNSRSTYAGRLRAWFEWRNGAPLNRETVLLYIREQERIGAGASVRNQTLAALKRLANEAAEQAWISHQTAGQIARIKSTRVLGSRTGLWLSTAQCTQLLDAPSQANVRDRAILALLIGCALRRAELCSLTARHIVERHGKTLIENLTGKGGRTRSLVIPGWAAQRLAEYRSRTRSYARPCLFPISTTAVRDLVKKYGRKIGVEGLAPHDLRRTSARLAREAGAPLEVIQKTLGHASVRTTELYTQTGEEANAGEWIAL